MAIKKKKPVKIEVVNNSKINPLETQFYSLFQTLSNAQAQGITEPSKQLGFDDLYYIAQRTWLGNALINYHLREIIQYTRPSIRDFDKGFDIIMTDDEKSPTPIDKQNIRALINFITNTGFVDDDDREDSFTDYITKITRDLLILDQHATEIQRNKRGEVVAFWAIDGSSIRRTVNSLIMKQEDERRFYLSTDYVDKKIKYVQFLDNKVTAEYTKDDLIFGYMNKRTHVRYTGYGYSMFEQALDIATTLVYALDYNKSQFRFDRLPRGVLAVQGINDTIAEKIAAIIRGTMSGYGGKHRIPILPLTESGKDIQWIKLDQNNREMEFYKFQLFLTSAFAAITGIDLASIGFKSNDSQNVISNESGRSNETKYMQSRNVAIYSILTHLEDNINKLIKQVTPNYKLRFTGLEVENKTALLEIKKKELETTKSINDIRIEDDQKPLKIMLTKDLNLFDIPGIQNPQVTQLIQSYVQNQQMQQSEGQEDEESGFNEDDYQEAIEQYQS